MDMVVTKKMAMNRENSQVKPHDSFDGGIRMSGNCDVFDSTDLLEAILVWVPPQSISNCILVSKHWLGLICSSCFLEHYIRILSVGVKNLPRRLLSQPLDVVSRMQHRLQSQQSAGLNQLQHRLTANQPHHQPHYSPRLAELDQLLHQLYNMRVAVVNQLLHQLHSERVRAMKQLHHTLDVQLLAVGIQFEELSRITDKLMVEGERLNFVNELQQQLQSRLLAVVKESLKPLPSQLLAGVNQLHHQVVSQLLVAVNEGQHKQYWDLILRRLHEVTEKCRQDLLLQLTSETGVAPSNTTTTRAPRVRSLVYYYMT